jgi:hypothetical protein
MPPRGDRTSAHVKQSMSSTSRHLRRDASWCTPLPHRLALLSSARDARLAAPQARVDVHVLRCRNAMR